MPIILLFLGLLIWMGFLQHELKPDPQLLLLGFIALVFVLKLSGEKKLSTALFYLLIGLAFFAALLVLTTLVVGFLNPDSSWVEVNGEREKVMDMNWVWGVLLGLLLSPLVVRTYHLSPRRNEQLELIFLGALTIISLVVYLYSRGG